MKMTKLTPLSKGCLPKIMADNYLGADPVLQMLGTRKVNGAGGNERFRLLLSDGQYVQSFAMLSTHLNDMIEKGDLPDNSIIRVKQHITSVVNRNTSTEKMVLIIVNLDVLHKGTDVGAKIGEPIPFDAKVVNRTESKPVGSTSMRPIDMGAKISKLEMENERQRIEIAKKNKTIAEQEVRIKELVTKIAEHGVKIDKLETSISEVLSLMEV